MFEYIEMKNKERLIIRPSSDLKNLSENSDAIKGAFVIKSEDGQSGWHVVFQGRGVVYGLASARQKDSLRVFKSIDAAFSAVAQCNCTKAIVDSTIKATDLSLWQASRARIAEETT